MRWFNLGGSNDPPPEHTGPKGMDRGRRIGITLCFLMYRMRVREMDRVPPSVPCFSVCCRAGCRSW